MSGYNSYQKLQLERQIADLEHELIALKTPQIYGTSQAQAYKSNVVEFDCSIIYHTLDLAQYGDSGKIISFGSNPTRLRFIGDKPGQTIVAQLKMEVVGSGGFVVSCNYLKALRTDQPHILDWWVFVNGSDASELHGGSDPPTPQRTAHCWVMTNDTGLLSIAETHSIHNHYQWITGSYYG